jgi:GT2 family glycosyltransferase
LAPLAVVAIGRNEGERLRTCLRSSLGQCSSVVYVDSGSTDGSVALARGMGVHVVELDSSLPFTAARARNAGFDRACFTSPDLKAVQFVDADCELAAGWLARGECAIQQAGAAVVFGRRRERFPEKSVYIRLSDFELDVPVGEARNCGGDALVRADAFRQAGGFNPALIAGEEPELCVRLRANGWKILRIEGEMTLHDIGITRFHQWWKRSVRTGHAYAEGAWLHGMTRERHWLRETLSVWFWGAALPLGAAAALLVAPRFALLVPAAYLLLILRIYLRIRTRARDAWAYSLLYTLGKFPQMLGQCRFHFGRWSRRPSCLIEYKATLNKPA